MKQKFSRRDFLKMSMLGLGSVYLAACGKVFTPTPPASTMAPPTTNTSTPVPPRPTSVPYVTNEPYALYDFADSFEGISDLGAYGITSSQNSVKVNNTNYNTIYQTGHQSIEADGTIEGKSGSSLSIEFNVEKILGSSTYDFSNKVLVIAVFIPVDSPIDEIVFETDRGDQRFPVNSAKITLNPHVSYKTTATLPKGQWVEAVIDLKDAINNNPLWFAWGPNGQLTDAQALEVVKNCDVFNIQGRRETEGNAVPTYFLLDDLRWLDRDSIKIDSNADSLRKYAANTHLFIGNVANYDKVFSLTDSKFPQVLAQEYNLVVPGESISWMFIEPTEGAINFSMIDGIVDFAIGNHMAINNYGAWHINLPKWLTNKNFSELGPILTNYIDTYGKHFRGKITLWYVFNEVINDAGTGFRNRQALPNIPYGIYSPWVDGSDTSLIKAAFKQARIADPNAKLFLNDFQTEEMGRQKAEFFYSFVKELIAENIPIDGVGFEMHATYPPVYPNTPWGSPRIMDLPAYLRAVDANAKRYAALGLKVAFSEVDVPIFIKDIDTSTVAGQAELKRRLDYEAQIFSGLMKVALANPNVIVFSTMDLTDRYSWVYQPDTGAPDYGYPDMLDKEYQPKPAYTAILNALKNWR